MAHDPNLNKEPDWWKVVLRGQENNTRVAAKAIYDNLKEAWRNSETENDGNEITVTIILKWLDPGITQMVDHIIESDHKGVNAIYNGGIYEDVDGDNKPKV